MTPVADREDRAAAAKRQVAEREPREAAHRRRRAERARRRRAQGELAAETRATQAAARPVVSRKPSPYKPKSKDERALERLTRERTVSRRGPGLALRGSRDFRDMAVGVPTGVYQLGKAVALDERDVFRASRRGDSEGLVPYSRTRKLARATGHQLVEDVRHPLRHPGYTAASVLGVLAGGAGTGVQVAATGRAVSAAARAAKLAKPPPRLHVAPRSRYKDLDPGGLGVRRFVRELDASQRVDRPARAALRALLKRRRTPYARSIFAGNTANVMARRERAAKELAAEARATQAAARPVVSRKRSRRRRVRAGKWGSTRG